MNQATRLANGRFPVATRKSAIRRASRCCRRWPVRAASCERPIPELAAASRSIRGLRHAVTVQRHRRARERPVDSLPADRENYRNLPHRPRRAPAVSGNRVVRSTISDVHLGFLSRRWPGHCRASRSLGAGPGRNHHCGIHLQHSRPSNRLRLPTLRALRAVCEVR